MGGILNALGALGNRQNQIDNVINQAVQQRQPQSQPQQNNAQAQQAAALQAQQAYQQQQQIESSPQYINDTFQWHVKNPGSEGSEENPAVRRMLMESGAIKQPSTFGSIFGFGK